MTLTNGAQAEPSFFRARLRMATCHSRLGDLPAALATLGPDATSAANLAEAAGKRAELEALQERLNKVHDCSHIVSACHGTYLKDIFPMGTSNDCACLVQDIAM